MSLKSAVRRFHRESTRLINSGALNSGDVILRWRVPGAVPEGADPDLQSTREAMDYTDATETKKAFIHYVNIHTTGFVTHAEIKTGDIILDFPGDVAIDGKESLRFEIDDPDHVGEIYVQKTAGKDLARSWDVRCNGVKITRTVLVTRLS